MPATMSDFLDDPKGIGPALRDLYRKLYIEIYCIDVASGIYAGKQNDTLKRIKQTSNDIIVAYGKPNKQFYSSFQTLSGTIDNLLDHLLHAPVFVWDAMMQISFFKTKRVLVEVPNPFFGSHSLIDASIRGDLMFARSAGGKAPYIIEDA